MINDVGGVETRNAAELVGDFDRWSDDGSNSFFDQSETGSRRSSVSIEVNHYRENREAYMLFSKLVQAEASRLAKDSSVADHRAVSQLIEHLGEYAHEVISEFTVCMSTKQDIYFESCKQVLDKRATRLDAQTKCCIAYFQLLAAQESSLSKNKELIEIQERELKKLFDVKRQLPPTINP